MIRLYMDVHVRREVTVGLRLRGVDVLTAQEDDAATLPDAERLTRATELGRVFFSQDTRISCGKLRLVKLQVPHFRAWFSASNWR